MGNFILAVATLIGTIIGVGMFALPYAAAQAGFKLTLVYLVVLGVVVTLVHLIYGEIILRTCEKHRLPGYAKIYLGRLGGAIIFFEFFISLYLALLAYLLVGGEFLSLIFSGWLNISFTAGTIILAVLGFGVVFKGLKLTGAFEFLMTAALIVLIIGLGLYAPKYIQAANFNLPAHDIFLPYGLILFALAGGSAIPEISNFFTGGKKRNLKWAIIIGTFIPVVAYAIFITSVLGISGFNTSPEAIRGLAPYLGSGFVRWGALAGFLAVITSFFTIGLNIKNSLIIDFKLPQWLGFILTAGVPLVLYFSGFKNFIGLLSWAGAVLGGLEGVLLLAIWSKAKKFGDRQPEYSIKLSPLLKYLLILVFLVGVVYQFVY